MIRKTNHIAIAVPDLDKAIAFYRDILGIADITPPQDLHDHGVRVVFVETDNQRIELLYPLGNDSPIASFLNKNAQGGIHHICFETDDILQARDHLLAHNMRILGDGNPKIGAHGKPVLFLHPKDSLGCLIELEQV